MLTQGSAMTNTTVIVLTGSSGSGKDTLAGQLTKHFGYERYSFGDALRQIVYEKFDKGWVSQFDERTPDYSEHGSFKDTMLYVGGQLAIAEPSRLSRLLVNKLYRHANSYTAPVVVTDCRKPIELWHLMQMTGIDLYFVEIVRPSNPHKSKRLDNLLVKGHKHSTLIQPLAQLFNYEGMSGCANMSSLMTQLQTVLETELPYQKA